MRTLLDRWIRNADSVRHFEHFGISDIPRGLREVRSRTDDYYLSLVGELFQFMRTEDVTPADWAQLGNALALFTVQDPDSTFSTAGVSQAEATLYAAAAFYYGGFPASAHLIAHSRQRKNADVDGFGAGCFDLLERPESMASDLAEALRKAVRVGDRHQIEALRAQASLDTRASLSIGPSHWIAARLTEKLIERFARTNVRAVLPDGESDLWNPLVESLLARSRWEFFPSQIAAIGRGLLEGSETFSLQMPTGSGKTVLCETLLYRHAKTTDHDVGILLVPYRSLASELRGSLVQRFNSMGIATRCAYGGTVPTGAEAHNLAEVRVMVATPEALSGIVGADPSFFRRVSLVVCDEGHLLDSPGRGVSLELLLARFRSRSDGPPRFVFVSAIVPNIEEINAWLGGSDESAIRSEYRPAVAEFAVLRPQGNGVGTQVTLEINPLEESPARLSIPRFLKQDDFRWWNATTNRWRTHNAGTVKTQAIATARKVLPMGAVAVFATNKRGTQGAVGLAEELLVQLDRNLPLPRPSDYVTGREVKEAMEYLQQEYGCDWVGTRALDAGSIVHHGDIPQETREVLEELLRGDHVRFVICTTTLAEGVNLPIRTLVLYSVQRRRPGGPPDTLKVRDIKNLAGRAGRAGLMTKGLVICSNPSQWPMVEPVAKMASGEPVRGFLRLLIGRLLRALTRQNVALSNQVLEQNSVLHSLTDGVDATLVDLLSEEMGEDEFIRQSIRLADETFASHQEMEENSKQLLRNVFEMRARRVSSIAANGRLDWIRETGARVRMLDVVERDLLPMRDTWDDVDDPLERDFVDALLRWAWQQVELRKAVREGFVLDQGQDLDGVQDPFFGFVRSWLSGDQFVVISRDLNVSIDDLLRIYTGAVAFVLQTLVEQAVAVLERVVEARGESVSQAVMRFPEHLRFGVPTEGARVLAAHGLRHRRAMVEIGSAVTERGVVEDRAVLFEGVRQMLSENPEGWKARLGTVVFRKTRQEVSARPA